MSSPDRRAGRFRRILPAMVVVAVQLGLGGAGNSLASGARPPSSAYGHVTSLAFTKRTQTLKGFTLANGKGIYSFRVNGNTGFIPRSSGADVQGFSQGVYAFVLSHSGLATSVEFDTRPFKPSPVEHVVGQVARTGQHSFVVEDASAARHKVWLSPETDYYVDGQAQQHAFPIKTGDDVDVFAQKPKSRWLAISIDEQTSTGGQ
jgi:hypothetical protein